MKCLIPVANSRQFSILRERFTSLFINLRATATLFILQGYLHITWQSFLQRHRLVTFGNIIECFGECKFCASNDLTSKAKEHSAPMNATKSFISNKHLRSDVQFLEHGLSSTLVDVGVMLGGWPVLWIAGNCGVGERQGPASHSLSRLLPLKCPGSIWVLNKSLFPNLINL